MNRPDLNAEATVVRVWQFLGILEEAALEYIGTVSGDVTALYARELRACLLNIDLDAAPKI